MEALGQYLLRIVAIALSLGALSQLVHSGTGKRILGLCSGLCMALVVLSPLTTLLQRDFWENPLASLPLQTQTAENLEDVRIQLSTIISEQTATYILDKARSINAAIQVDVTVAPLGAYYVQPSNVIITGKLTAEQKQTLAQWLQEELGLTGGQIQWNGSS